MRFVAKVGLITGALCFVAGPSLAGFKDNFSQWQEMDRYGQYSYVMGLFDADANGSALGEPAWVTTKRAGIAECALELKLTPSMIAEAVTRHYEQHSRDWGIPVAPIFNRVVQNVCLDFINQKRASGGLPRWKPANGGIMDSLAP